MSEEQSPCHPVLLDLPVGITRLNTLPSFSKEIAAKRADLTGLPFVDPKKMVGHDVAGS
jgi:hypothetical protein